jgi:hypothetical protein
MAKDALGHGSNPRGRKEAAIDARTMKWRKIARANQNYDSGPMSLLKEASDAARRTAPHGTDVRGTEMRMRTMLRAQDNYLASPDRPANAKHHAIYNSPEAWARRRAASNPANAGKLRFEGGRLMNKIDAKGNLLD